MKKWKIDLDPEWQGGSMTITSEDRTVIFHHVSEIVSDEYEIDFVPESEGQAVLISMHSDRCHWQEVTANVGSGLYIPATLDASYDEYMWDEDERVQAEMRNARN